MFELVSHLPDISIFKRKLPKEQSLNMNLSGSEHSLRAASELKAFDT